MWLLGQSDSLEKTTTEMQKYKNSLTRIACIVLLNLFNSLLNCRNKVVARGLNSKKYYQFREKPFRTLEALRARMLLELRNISNVMDQKACLSMHLSPMIRLLSNYLFCIHPLHTPHLFHQEKKGERIIHAYLSMERCEPQYNKLNRNCENRDRGMSYYKWEQSASSNKIGKRKDTEEGCTCNT